MLVGSLYTQVLLSTSLSAPTAHHIVIGQAVNIQVCRITRFMK